MTYALGIDLGTTYTSTAVCEPGARPRPVKLGDLSDSVPTVIFARPEGPLYGEIAELRGPSDPTRVIRNVKARLGSDTPVVAGGESHDPVELIGGFLAWLIERASRLRGAPPDRIAMTHPAHWGSYLLERLAEALHRAGQPDPIFLSEPEAAGIAYVSSEKIEVDRLVGVYDFGGGTFDAAVMRRTPRGFALQGKPAGVDTIGGNVFDGLIFRFVMDSLGGSVPEESPEVFAAVQSLRERCRVAKRVLSDDTAADIPVILPDLSTSIRITRAEFEGLIQRHVAESVALMSAVIESAGVGADDLSSVLMVGGTSRVPLVSQMLGRALDCPLAFDIEPKMSVAVGAAVIGARGLEQLPSMSPVGSSPERRSAVARSRPLPPVGPPVDPPISSPSEWSQAPSPADAPTVPVEGSPPVTWTASTVEPPAVDPLGDPKSTVLGSVASESSHYAPFVPTPVVTPEPVEAEAEETVLPPSDTDWWAVGAAGAAVMIVVSYLLLRRLDAMVFWLVVAVALWSWSRFGSARGVRGRKPIEGEQMSGRTDE